VAVVDGVGVVLVVSLGLPLVDEVGVGVGVGDEDGVVVGVEADVVDGDGDGVAQVGVELAVAELAVADVCDVPDAAVVGGWVVWFGDAACAVGDGEPVGPRVEVVPLSGGPGFTGGRVGPAPGAGRGFVPMTGIVMPETPLAYAFSSASTIARYASEWLYERIART
jgi:hypothetical protein